MKEAIQQQDIYRPLMAGVFTGIIATFCNLVFDVLYRQSTGFNPSEIINVSTIIFGTLLILTLSAIIFIILDKYIRQVTVVYIVLFALLTILCAMFALHTNRSDDALQTTQFRGLLLGIVIISGSLATFLIPYLVKKNTSLI